MSKKYSKLLTSLILALTSPLKPYRRAIVRAKISEHLIQLHHYEKKGKTILFESPSARSLHDSLSIDTNEKETIDWLDDLPEGANFWDIGANVGVYSLYAAKMRNANVMAFEPSSASYAALNRNVEINNLDNLIQSYCIAFSNETALDYLRMKQTAAGHSMHAFGQDHTVNGKINVAFNQAVPGFTIDDFIETFKIQPPEYIKLDVDSIEEKIIIGGINTFKKYVKSVIVEIEEENSNISRSPIYKLLLEQGFTMVPPNSQRNRNVVFTKN